jgi:hypothetical protein
MMLADNPRTPAVLDADGNPRVVLETLGDGQISLTLNTYSHVLPDLRADAAKRMDPGASDWQSEWLSL